MYCQVMCILALEDGLLPIYKEIGPVMSYY